MQFEFRIVIFYWKYILARENNCNFVETMIKLKLEKSVQNLLKTTEVHTEKGNRSMPVTFSVSLHGTSGTCLTGSCVFIGSSPVGAGRTLNGSVLLLCWGSSAVRLNFHLNGPVFTLVAHYLT